MLLPKYYSQELIRVRLIGAFLNDETTDPDDAEVGYQLTSTGFEQEYEGLGGTYSTRGTWLLDGSASDYDCRLTVDLDLTPSGSATGTWLNLGTTRAWTLSDTAPIGAARTSTCTIEIRDATTLDVLDSATVFMSVLVNPA